ncbi:MAG TPA: anti-sigma factor [Gemmataceae bacterium]|jgi:anti-sigma factor RsiW|nr:anti-sigma factor [Gemmataceae bacterium]
MNCHDAQAVLHGYLDGELDPSVSLNYEQHVGACPACGKALAEQQALQAEMKADSLYFKAPAILRDRLRASLRQQYGTGPVRLPWRWLAVAACLAVCTCLGFLLARFTFTPSAQERLTQEVASAHIRSLQAQHIVDVPSTDRHEVKPWFNGKLDFAPPTPDLEKEGFPLVGGRLDYLGGRPVAAIVYSRREHLINLFIWPDSGSEPGDIQQVTRQGYHLVHWSKAGMNHWLVSDLDPTELGELARRLRE